MYRRSYIEKLRRTQIEGKLMELPEIIAFVGIDLLTLIGVVITAIATTKHQLRNIFSSICRSPATEVASYEDVYNKIFSYYKLYGRTDLVIIDKQYLLRCIEALGSTINKESKVKFDKPEHYKFPLICENWWLKSKCPNLLIDNKLVKTKNDRDVLLSDDKLKKSIKFLNSFQIENYPDFLASIGKEIWNGRTFDLCFIKRENNKLELHFALGRYFNYVKYNDLIAKELYFHLYIKNNKEFSKQLQLLWLLNRLLLNMLFSKKLTLRDTVPQDQIFNFEGRPVKLGIIVFVLMKKNDEKYCTFIQKREEHQVEHPGFYNVAPAGAFQPLSVFDKDIIEKQFLFQYTVLREFLEEVYDLEEADRKNRSADPFNIFKIEKEKNSGFRPGKLLLTENEIKEGIPLRNDKYEIIQTGFLIDLVSLKPELTVLLHIKDKKVYSESKEKNEGNWEGQVKEYDIESDDFINFLNENLNINNFSPAGAVALAEGLNYYLTRIKNPDT